MTPGITPARLLTHHGILYRSGIVHPLRGIQYLQSNDVAVFVVVQNHARLLLVAFIDGRVAEKDTQDINIRIIGDFHWALQYLLILLVRYTVTTMAGSKGRFDQRQHQVATCTPYFLPFLE